MQRILIAAFCLGGLAASQTPSANELIEKHIRATGDPESAGGIRSLVRRGVVRQGSAEIPAELQAVPPGKWRLLLDIPGAYRVEMATDGQECWEQTPAGTEAMPAALFAQLNPVFSLAFLLDPGPRLQGMRVKGREQSQARDVWAAEVTGQDGKPLAVHFDAQTGLLVRFGGSVLEDYRKVEGIAVPHIAGISEGRMQFTFHAMEAALNVPLEAASFVKETNTAAYRKAQRASNAEALEKWGKGVEFGAAREVLLDMGDFTPQDGRILYDVIAAKGYKRGLEIGTARGNSAIWMGLAFRKNGGKLTTLEMNADRAQIAKENFRKAGLTDVVECRVNDAFKEILVIEGNFDFVFMDTGTPMNQKFLDLLYARVVAGGAIAAHNANDFERFVPDFFKTITTDPNLETKITRTPSGGVSVSVKKK